MTQDPCAHSFVADGGPASGAPDYCSKCGEVRLGQPEQGPEGLAAYDAGLLGDFGGGDVFWWHDYLRAELARAHEFYESQLAALAFSLDWPDLASVSMPRNEAGSPAHPVLETLAFASMPWKLVDFARSLQLAGVPIPKKAEAEYAAALAWLVGHALRHGNGWREAAMDDLRAMQAKVQEAATE